MQEFSFEVVYETGNIHNIKHSFGNVSKQFPIASVTKIFTSYLALIMVEKNLITLEDVILPNNINVQDLLSHSSGIAFDKYEFIHEKHEFREYSNIGIEIVGEYLTDVTGIEFEILLEKEILLPLGIENFEMKGEKKPSKDGWASVKDLRIMAKELLYSTLISKELFHKATMPYLHLPGLYLNDMKTIDNHAWGLGFEIKADKPKHWMGELTSESTFGHFGSSGAFMLIDPNLSIYNIFLGEKKYNFEHRRKWNKLNDELVEKHNYS